MSEESVKITVKERREKNGHNPDYIKISPFRIIQAMKLREAGLSYQEVSDEMGYKSGADVKNMIANTLRKIDSKIVETWETLRKMEHQELSALEGFILMQIQDNMEDINAVVKLIDRLLKTKELKYDLLGIKSPEQIEISHQLPQINLTLPAVPLNENKLVDKVIEIRDSSDELLGQLPEEVDSSDDLLGEE